MSSSNNKRPNQIDLGGSQSFQPPRFPGTPPADLPPPRSGDVPPALSPLDAFALQSNILAARFDHDDNGRRISRLPHHMIATEFQRPRHAYFTNNSYSPSQGAPADHPAPAPEPSGTAPEISKTSDKHKSYYPHVQTFDDAASVQSYDTSATDRQQLESVSEESPKPYDYRARLRSDSPDSFVDARSSTDPSTSRLDFAPGLISKSSTNESLRSNTTAASLVPPSYAFSDISRSPRIPSALPLRTESGDDSDSKSLKSEPNELRPPKGASANNYRDRPRSPFSPPLHARRSPSISSEISNPETGQPRRSVNFSRPMSPAARFHRPSVESNPPRPSFEFSTRTLQVESPDLRDTRPSIDVLSLQESIHDSPAMGTRPFALDDLNGNLTDDENASFDRRSRHDEAAPAESYTYTRYALPRGRKVMSRTSVAAADWLASKFDWDKGQADGEAASQDERGGQQLSRQATLEAQPIEEKPEPVSRPSTSKGPGFKGRFVEVMDDDDEDTGPPPSFPPQQPSNNDLGIRLVPPTPSGDGLGHRSRSFDDVRNRPETLKKQKSNPGIAKSAASTPTDRDFPDTSIPTLHPKGGNRSRTKSDVRERQLSNVEIPSMPDQISAEQHLTKGIASHEEGHLQKSTYHLRLAARGGNPTAMLLYALACRHGWGMRPNQSEGINWLRRAVDLSKVEVGNDQLLLKGPNMDGKAGETANDPASAAAKRAHKAQLALSIYELGMSYMNGWGITTDKVLALRCFEIGGGWGDADALAEAGFCYAKGVGCKKDLFKAADFYRRAEAKGISMAGNSWIYKEKYMPKEDEADERKGRSADKDKDDKKKKPRDKSRTRTFFGGRKKTIDTPP